jgi:hypothetical protein
MIFALLKSQLVIRLGKFPKFLGVVLAFLPACQTREDVAVRRLLVQLYVCWKLFFYGENGTPHGASIALTLMEALA